MRAIPNFIMLIVSSGCVGLPHASTHCTRIVACFPAIALERPPPDKPVRLKSGLPETRRIGAGELMTWRPSTITLTVYSPLFSERQWSLYVPAGTGQQGVVGEREEREKGVLLVC